MDYCNIYINEKSAIAQFTDMESAGDAVNNLIECLSLFDCCDKSCVTVKKYYCAEIYKSFLTHNKCLQNMSDKDLKKKFKLVLQTASNWEDAPLSDMEAIYTHTDVDVSNSSMSEAYENRCSVIVNILYSGITEPIADVEKENNIRYVDSFSIPQSLDFYLIGKGWKKREYDFESRFAPRDEESILSIRSVFEPTPYRYKGRTIYRRIGTSELCYIDSKHYGLAAHIEVFDEVSKNMICKLKINQDGIFKKLTSNEKRRKLRFDNR